MKNFCHFISFLLLIFVLSLFVSCNKEQSEAPKFLAVKYTNLTLDDLSELPNPAASEQFAKKLFDLKEDGGLTDQELRSLGDPATNEDLLYALLFVEAYDRDEILWSWQDNPVELPAETGTEDRSNTAKWRWTGGPSLASMYCSGFKKWPAQPVKNRFQDPCGEVVEGGPSYQCCFQLCDADMPVPCQSGCVGSVTIPAGSVNALAAAINNACVNGTIILAAGVHTENDGIVISKKVHIVGQNGAVLKVNSSPWNGTAPLDVALHFYNARNSSIKNIDIQTIPDIGGTAILLENSHGARVEDNYFTNFQISVYVEYSDNTHIEGNTVAASLAWATGVIPVAFGIVVSNGKGAEVQDNDVSQGLFGIWACAKNGKAEGNNTHGNYIGFILCKVPAAYQMPFGTQPSPAVFSATNWKVKNNSSTFNQWGYLSIDGSNHNLIENNAASDNAVYDIELTADSYRFGFLTPHSSNETVKLGSYSGLIVKDCGVNNTIVGNAVMVDTGVDACF